MSESDTPIESHSMDPTVELPPSSTSGGAGLVGHIDLVEGNCGGMSDEIRALLHCRLRSASFMLFLGFSVILAWRLIGLPLGLPTDNWALVNLIFVTAVLGINGLSLCRKCSPRMSILRLKELLVFGLPACFLLQIEYIIMTDLAAQKIALPNPAAMWLLLIFTYALFIPNSWRRAALFLLPFAIAPLAMLCALAVMNTSIQQSLLAKPSFVVELALMMVIGYLVAVAGSYTIGTLRREAYEARQFGQYQLREKLGSGGMGEVFLAEHQLMKRPCAIKIIRPEKAGDPKVLARFAREVRTIAKLTHWNSVDIFDYGRSKDGTFYYVMEYLPGMNLQDLVRQHGPLPPERTIYLMRQACDALREAHSFGIIHRDIKPANIYVSERGGVYDVVKVLDFGLAKPLNEMGASDLTQDGAITGSPHFMSPEQVVEDEAPDARSDVYALGCVAYFALTGRPPFHDDKMLKILFAHANQPPVPPSELRDDLPADLEKVVLRCLEKKRQDRYQSTGELCEAFAACEAADKWNRYGAAYWWNNGAGQADIESVHAAETMA